ncbi:glycoside hydrolase family 5 protein [Moniliophthora roreri]|nr:glycoside hydrolase family 5 protein [Moniliophthora roreri]
MADPTQAPLLPEQDVASPGPQQRFLGHDLDSPSPFRDSFPSTVRDSQYAASDRPLNPGRDTFYDGSDREGASPQMNEKAGGSYPSSTQKASRRKPLIIAAIAAAIIIILAIILGVYFGVTRTRNRNGSSSPSQGNSNSDSGSGSAGSGEGSDGGIKIAITGGDGSEVTLEDGTTFIYSNPHGGHWYYDPNDPFNNGAKAQSWTPALNETFNYGVDRVRGVNVGGWLNIEPFMQVIVPALFQKYSDVTPTPVDEYTLHSAMRAHPERGGLDDLEEHYKTFITEKDFAEIAAAGLNYVRIPIPYWAIDVQEGEPFLPKVAWKYFLKAVGWARKYGLRINLDLHAVPGSQNNWNHSGRLNAGVNMMNGPMGLANAQRTLDYIRILAEFIHQPQYRDVITMFGILNEPREAFIGAEQLESFHAQAYRVVREVTGSDDGAWVSIHEGFRAWGDWDNFLPNHYRLALDHHPYIAFGDQVDSDWTERTRQPCDYWAQNIKDRLNNFGLTTNGEYSNAINDCGLFLNGVTEGVRYDGSYVPQSFPRAGSCDKYTDWQNFTPERKEGIKRFAMASMDALHNYFFWTWKIGNSSVTGKVETPAWSYQLGLENGWMPKDPREADGFCGDAAAFNSPIQPGSGNVNYAQYPWPPASIRNAGSPSTLPRYTATGPVPTLTGGTLTISGVTPTRTVDVGNGWANPNDQAGAMVPIQGCTYPDIWAGDNAAVPPVCGVARREAEPKPTPPPMS